MRAKTRRLQAEYGLPVDYETSRFSVCRWVSSDSEAELDKFIDSHGSAMAKEHLGTTFDIHGGGQDLIFPHHENMQPIALLQSRFNQIKVAERKRIGVEHN